MYLVSKFLVFFSVTVDEIYTNIQKHFKQYLLKMHKNKKYLYWLCQAVGRFSVLKLTFVTQNWLSAEMDQI